MCSVHKELNYSTNKRHFTMSTSYLHTFKGKKALGYSSRTLSLQSQKKISLCCLLHFQDFLENLAACHNVFPESYFSIFSEMFPFSGLCTRCAIFCAFFSCCCFAAQVNRATRCCSSAFCIDQSQHQQSDWVLKCASVALVNCTSR